MIRHLGILIGGILMVSVGSGFAGEAREGEMCDGIAGIACKAKGDYCQHPTGTCDVADGAGICKPVPQVCTEEWEPVCGCDGETYGNVCEAAMKRVSLDYKGACRSEKPDETRQNLEP